MARMLTGPELAVLHKGIVAAFDEETLPMMILFRLDKVFGGGAGEFDFLVYRLVSKANRQGWWPELLIAARNSVPGNPVLIEAEALLLASSHGSNLEKVVDIKSAFRDVHEFGKRHSQLVNAVCVIEDSGGGLGTGWLVAKDIVLTNHHVVQRFIRGDANSHDLKCRFDFKIVDGSTHSGREVSLAEKWCIADRPYGQSDISVGRLDWQPHELDYALLRLAEPVGSEPVGEKPEPGAMVRGWIALPSTPPPVAKDDRLWVFQHPQDLSKPGVRRLQPMKLSDGKVLGWFGNNMRLRHDALTLPGSSGSVCCDGELRVVALHHAGDAEDWPDYRGAYNQAIPVGLIVADLMARPSTQEAAIEPFWDKPPPVVCSQRP